MVHNELHAIDLGIIAAYLIAMVTIGVVMVKRVQNTDDYYLGGRSFGPLVLMATVCATIIGGSGLMGRAGVAYSSGFKDHDGAAVSAGDVHLLRLRRAHLSRGHDVQRHVHPRPLRAALRQNGEGHLLTRHTGAVRWTAPPQLRGQAQGPHLRLCGCPYPYFWPKRLRYAPFRECRYSRGTAGADG